MKSKPQKAFAAIFKPDGWVPSWTIAGSAQQVREMVGRSWLKENPAEGWRAAKIEGAKVVKVEIRIVK